MALIKGQIYGDMSGKLGGSVFTRNSSGKMIRARVQPTDAKSGAQIANRSRFSSSVSGWNTLTDTLRSGWNVFAVTLFSAKKGNKSGRYSGYQAYSSSNQALAAVQGNLITPTMTTPSGTLTVTAPPTFVTNPPQSAFNTNIQKSTGEAVSLSLNAVTFAVSTRVVTIDVQLSESLTVAPVFKNPVSLSKVNFSLSFSNIMRAGATAVNKLCVYNVLSAGFITVSSGWTASSKFVLSGTVPADYLSSLKMNFSVGSRFYATLFCVSDSGQSCRVGSVLVTAS